MQDLSILSSIEQLQIRFDELTKELKEPLPTDVYSKLWDERVWIKSLITEKQYVKN